MQNDRILDDTDSLETQPAEMGYELEDEQPVADSYIPAATPSFVFQQIANHRLLLEQFELNDEDIKKKIVDMMLRNPTKNDSPGFVYGFREKINYNPNAQDFLIKIGRTKMSTPELRFFQWERDDSNQYNQMFTIRTEANGKLEGLVHLFFNYARLHRIINGKRRIQWFNFKKKTLCAAIISIINFIMEMIHSNQLPSQSLSCFKVFSPDQLKSSLKNLKIAAFQSRVVLLGLPKSGKTTLMHMLIGASIQVTKTSYRKFKTICAQSQQNQRFVELKGHQDKISLKSFLRDFQNWLRLCQSQELYMCLSVQQADFESTGMRSLIESLMIYERCAEDANVVIAIHNCNHDFREPDVRGLILENKDLLSESHFRLLITAEYIFISHPIAEDNFYYEKINKISKVSILSKELFKNNSFKNECLGFLEWAHSEVELIYQGAICKKSGQMLTNGSGIPLRTIGEIRQIQKLIEKTVDKNTSLQAMYKHLKQFHTFIELPHATNLIAMLYVYCECVTNGDMRNTFVFRRVKVTLQDMQSQVNQLIYKEVSKHLKIIKTLLGELLLQFSGMKDMLRALRDCKEEQEMRKILTNMAEILSLNQNHSLVFQSFFEMLEDRKVAMESGCRIDNVLGRVKVICFDLLGKEDRRESERIREKQAIPQRFRKPQIMRQPQRIREPQIMRQPQRIREPQIMREPQRIREVVRERINEERLQNIILASVNRAMEQNRIQNIPPATVPSPIRNPEIVEVRPAGEDKNKAMAALRQISCLVGGKVREDYKINISTFSEIEMKAPLSSYLTVLQAETFILNIATIKINRLTVVFAKRVTVDERLESLSISFAHPPEKYAFNKAHFIVFAQKFQGTDKIQKYSRTSKYGVVCFLEMGTGKMQPVLDHYKKNPWEMKNANVDEWATLYFNWKC